MKPWLGAIGRACIEFPILLALIAVVSGLSSGLTATGAEGASLALNIGLSALELIPLALVATVFLSFFAFDSSVRSRTLGYAGLLLVGVLGFTAAIALHRIPLSASARATRSAAAVAELPPPSVAYNRDGTALWFRSVQGDTLTEAVAIDFRSPFPRLVHARSGSFDRATGIATVSGRNFLLSAPSADSGPLVPEAAAFEGALIWDRIAALAEAPLGQTAIVAAGFLLLLLGFRFVARVTAWPLANAMLSVSAAIGLLAADAAVSGLWAAPLTDALAAVGLVLERPHAVAAAEGLVGLILIGLDLLLAPRRAGEAS